MGEMKDILLYIVKSKIFISLAFMFGLFILLYIINPKLMPLAIVANMNLQYYFSYKESRLKKLDCILVVFFNIVSILMVLILL